MGFYRRHKESWKGCIEKRKRKSHGKLFKKQAEEAEAAAAAAGEEEVEEEEEEEEEARAIDDIYP